MFHFLQVKSGMVTLNDGKTRPQPIKIQLSNDTLTLLKEEFVPVYQEENANDMINKVIGYRNIIG